jgi:hypothetical protein
MSRPFVASPARLNGSLKRIILRDPDKRHPLKVPLPFPNIAYSLWRPSPLKVAIAFKRYLGPSARDSLE